jgi:hypothetical protein
MYLTECDPVEAVLHSVFFVNYITLLRFSLSVKFYWLAGPSNNVEAYSDTPRAGH